MAPLVAARFKFELNAATWERIELPGKSAVRARTRRRVNSEAIVAAGPNDACRYNDAYLTITRPPSPPPPLLLLRGAHLTTRDRTLQFLRANLKTHTRARAGSCHCAVRKDKSLSRVRACFELANTHNSLSLQQTLDATARVTRRALVTLISSTRSRPSVRAHVVGVCKRELSRLSACIDHASAWAGQTRRCSAHLC